MQGNRYTYSYRQQPRRKRVRLKPRFFLLTAVVIGLLAYGVSRLVGTSSAEAVITEGELKFGRAYQALLVRQEDCYSTESYGSIEFAAGEGAEVSEGDVILSVYASTGIDARKAELEQVRTEIADYLKQDAVINKIIDKDLVEYDRRVADITEEISAMAQKGAGGAMLKTENALRQLMQEREEYIKRTAGTRSDTTLMRLYERQNTLTTQINASKTEYKAQKDGRVSFHFDELELLLSPDMLDNATAHDVVEILADRMKARPNNKMLYRLVDTRDWYALLVTPESAWEVALGQSLNVSFDGYDNLSMSAVVHRLTVENGEALVILKLHGDGAPLMNARKVVVNTGGSARGLTVPLGAIRKSGETDVVTLKDNNATVPVRIIGQDGRNAVVEPVEPGALKEGMHIVYR